MTRERNTLSLPTLSFKNAYQVRTSRPRSFFGELHGPKGKLRKKGRKKTASEVKIDLEDIW